MSSAPNPREMPFPPPPLVEPPLAPEGADPIHAALFKLVWLSLYIAIMRLLGYRIRRQPTPRRSKPTAAPLPSVQAAPPTPRRKHRYLDRDMALATFAAINAALAPARCDPQGDPQGDDPQGAPSSNPQSARAPQPHPTTSGLSTPPARQVARPAVPNMPRPTARPHPPPREKCLSANTPTHAHFVTI